MTYTENFREMFRIGKIGYGIGFIIAAIWMILELGFFSLDFFIAILPVTIVVGSIVSVAVSTKSKKKEYLGKTIQAMLKGLQNSVIGSIFFGATSFFSVAGIIMLLFGLILFVPLLAFSCSMFFFNLIYFGIMSRFEKKGKLVGKDTVCMLTDKISIILSLIITIFVFKLFWLELF